MGLIKAALGAAGGVMADQWKEFFYCEAQPTDVLMSKGQKRTSRRSSNTKGEENIISNGSIIAVADGQCMVIVEQGKIVDFCAEPGEYTYDMSTEPSLFSGNLGDSIKQTFQTIGKRFTFGGDTAKDQRVYYFNTREIVGCKFGTPNAIPFRVVDERAGIDIDIGISCFGTYSFRLADPLTFYTKIAGNVSDEFKFTGTELERAMRNEFLQHLQPAFARISEMGVRYSALVGRTTELRDEMEKELTVEWLQDRGFQIEKIAIASLKANEEDEKMLKELQRNAAFMDPTRAAAFTIGSQGDAMKIAAGNANGAVNGFMGMGMVGGMGMGANVSNLYAMGQQQAQQAVQQPAPAAVPAGWTCSCGQTGNQGKFCQACGQPKPEPKPAPAADSWKCPSCGADCTGKFCPECGSPKPAAPEGWTCSCGAVNKGKFCPNCGAKKPAGVPQYKCDKCGWEPEKGATPPKFCPECGDPFDNGDIL